MAYRVEYGVKGAVRIIRKEFETLAEAERKAARWRASNSTDDYWAVVMELDESGLPALIWKDRPPKGVGYFKKSRGEREYT